MRITAIIISVSLFSAILLNIGCHKEPTALVRIGTNVWPGYEPLYLARELGYYKDLNVRLVEYPSASEVIRAFKNKNLER